MTAWETYNSKSTKELVEIFQKKGGTGTTKKNALFSLVHRFRQDILNKCEVRCKRFGHSVVVAETITENTFRAYGKKGNFDATKGRGKTVDDSFKIYLYSIAKNELTNYYRMEEKKKNGLFYNGTEEIITELPEVDLKELDTKARVRYEIIKSLTPSQRTVYLTYFAYEKIGCNLPGKLQAELRSHLGNVTQSTVRSFKKEANDRIKDGLRIMEITLNSKR